jgi:hypothetical protein
MNVELSVVIPTHNPRRDYLARVLDALKVQTLAGHKWELLIVDNQSDPPVESLVDLSWHPSASIAREERLGLTPARVRGFRETVGAVIVLVDDDNVLAPDYLEQSIAIADQKPFIGTWAGCIVPEYEQPEIAPPLELDSLLTLRRVASDIWSNDPAHHASTPWGAGLCVRRKVADAYGGEIETNQARASLDLKGGLLLYGGDTDISYVGCGLGFAKGVFAGLRVTHLIPANRCNVAYLSRVAFGRGYSEILHSYTISGTLPERNALSLSELVRDIRIHLRPRLQKSIALAYQRGQRQAFRDLASRVI